MDLSISITNWNTSDLLVRCLRSVVAHSQDLKFEVAVIDNGSTDADVRDIAKSFPDFRWKFNRNNTGGLSLNEAWNRIRGRYFLFLGSDAQIQPGCLQEMVRFLDSHPEAGGVSGLLLNPDGSIQHYYRRLPRPLNSFFCFTRLGINMDQVFLNRHFFRHTRYEGLRLDSVTEVEQPAGACLLIRSPLVREKSGLIIDPRFPFYYNDVDVCKRVYRAGYRIFVLPNAKVVHNMCSSFSRRSEQWKLGERYAGFLRYLFKHHIVWAWAFYVYLLCETLASWSLNYVRRIFSSDTNYFERIQEARQILSRIVVFSR